jgi:hypothetical protein
MPYTQTIILHITVPDDETNPTTWDWQSDLDLHLVDTISDNEFALESWSIYKKESSLLS